MEGRNNMVKTSNVNRWVKGFEVDRNSADSLKITHLQYADDTLIFCDAEEEQLRYLRIILVLFEGISGLHIYRRKSHIYPIDEVHNMEQLSLVVGGEVGSLPSIYLGMPLGARSKSKEIWNSVIEKCVKKLSRWKTQYLSMGGRLVLINSVLDSIPTYMMSLFPIPGGIIQRLDKLRRSFLWQGNKEKKVFHLVKWKSIIVMKRQGGLGIKNLKNQRKTLKMKWLWRYSQELQTLWSKVIKAKYGEENNWELYPDMFGLAQDQQKTVAETWSSQGWELILRRQLNDWEIVRLTDLYNKLETFKGIQEGVDSFWWQRHDRGVYQVKAAYKILNQNNPQIRDWPWKHIWKN
uniref:Uncharacterized protein n=2 Tax=Nicotiana TaxID=4085 RepID=A0A1S3Y0I5_TOBAC|nr:PREDICTED: uncharacterized protein LOC104246308 [Nicotiana sylvestris]XP_016445624.1 PREDICTED: uncharacterized protein LOC107770805 [Nicotiana tabacum]